ncbi:hypothetical protein COCC4DRAFT_202731 [Bipolaris maydis ATCC 48331]|uniref:Uncharacterized protein n=2 Tax=Cochliobolus heterostrophus TaxID=5016 RepID=M2UDL6_COCH5|nr:uncharacterized protein COCC4DRAFT_202731 [Bipolaris maydis ATCC 48331]EMD85977.1 hypothetical protein COCHEDRAFT_1198499 [Bipolaris maydis C5]KAH7562861.1 hypothetical protein BM1_02381 [Bipolaris maydis]ENI01980.1 hypothetical protein COCC4DRAFT_202731 [Bipolaris maydis ATCC 48331]KAJ5028239.1 hypothetical protein J3E73DRAFT_380732 [Bipolaris maydis]KAJ5063017.1 hypothetical protein J3E74DRAFT_473160 [Bipolaris maydis]
MARYQLRRPTPVSIFPRHSRRQDGAVTTMPLPERQKEEDEGPESPDSPFSSPSTVGGGSSSSEDSESDDDEEPPSPMKSGASSRPVQTLGPDPTMPPSLSSTATGVPALQVTTEAALSWGTGTTLETTTLPSTTSLPGDRIQSDRQKDASPTASVSLFPPPPPPPPPLSTAEAEMTGETSAAERLPEEQTPIMTKQAMVAAIVLGVLGALALLVAAIVFIKRRKSKQYNRHVSMQDDSFNSSMAQALRAPESAHAGTASSIFARLQGASNGGAEGHLTRSTDRSNTLFGPGEYLRPETVSTDRSGSRMEPPTPNPFADPQRNKAYDMLHNRPRSTTLTDRGSWRENPFKNPESDRFDPFGELKEKARRERLRYLEEAKREAELQRQLQQKEAMGLRPDDMPWGHDNGYR